MSRLYYDCPVKALYMMKEFWIKLECHNTDEEMQDYDLNEEDRFYPFHENSLNAPHLIEELMADFEGFRRIYVCKESEHIFEPKEDDISLGTLFDAFAQKPSPILMRDNKHFFYPKIEEQNDI